MGRYRKIDPRVWNDEKFRALTDDGKLAFLFLLTHPHMTALGAMRATLAGLADELEWAAARMSDAISHAMSHGMLVVNPQAKFVGLPKFLKYNEPEGPNSVTKAWIEALELIPECAEKEDTIHRCRKYLDGKSDAFRQAIGHAIWDAFAMPCPIQEQEQEQEQEEESAPLSAPVRPSNNNPGKPRPARQATAVHPIPEDFGLTPERQAYAEKHLPSVDAAALMEFFIGKSKADGWKKANWDQHWQTLVRQWAPNSGHWSANQYPKIPPPPQAARVLPIFR